MHLSAPERSKVVPGRWSVYDYDEGMVARKDDGSLAYFDTAREAEVWINEQAKRPGVKAPPRFFR